MAETATKLAVKTEKRPGEPTAVAMRPWWPLEGLRQEIDRLFEDFDGGMWRSPFRRSMFGMEPFWRRESNWAAAPAVDITENDKAYELSAELPGMEDKNIEVRVSNGTLTIKGEKEEEKKEEKKDYYLHERRFGSFERSFDVPDDVDSEKIEASFKKGVLTVKLPKKPEAQKAAKKIEVKSAA